MRHITGIVVLFVTAVGLAVAQTPQCGISSGTPPPGTLGPKAHTQPERTQPRQRQNKQEVTYDT